ncbi:hypothetical protein C8F01DRAFT_798726 [Mycena amicta]|nr:hypothetical protein C8F01DRAFT_798726 [Mycena amicta]
MPPPPRSPDEDALINTQPYAVLMQFRDTVFNPAHIASCPEKFINSDWVDVSELRAFLVRTGHLSAAPPIIKTEPDAGVIPAAAQIGRVIHEDGKEVLDICSSDSESEPEMGPGSDVSIMTSATVSSSVDGRRASSVSMEEVIDEDEIAARDRVKLPGNSRYIFEASPLPASSPPPIRRHPTVESLDDERDSDSEGEVLSSDSRYVLEPAIRAPAGHRSPTAFNAFEDWRVSDTDWGNRGMHSYTREGELKVTGHRTVKRVEYLFDLPPHIPIPDDAHDTAFVIDLDSSQFDFHDKHGRLHSIDGLIKKHDNDSWKGTTGSADTNVFVTFGEGQKPVLCRRSRLTCKGASSRSIYYCAKVGVMHIRQGCVIVPIRKVCALSRRLGSRRSLSS